MPPNMPFFFGGGADVFFFLSTTTAMTMPTTRTMAMTRRMAAKPAPSMLHCALQKNKKKGGAQIARAGAIQRAAAPYACSSARLMGPCAHQNHSSASDVSLRVTVSVVRVRCGRVGPAKPLPPQHKSDHSTSAEPEKEAPRKEMVYSMVDEPFATQVHARLAVHSSHVLKSPAHEHWPALSTHWLSGHEAWAAK